MKLTIAFPSKGICDPSFAVVLKYLRIPKEFTEFEVLHTSSADVAVARNILAMKATGDYIFFIDTDVLPPIDAIIRLYNHKKDIVSGLYFARQEPHFPQMFWKTKLEGKVVPDRYDCVADWLENSIIEIDACGFGCVLIKKSVFDDIETPYFQFIPGGVNQIHKGEDYYFCEKAKEKGYDIFCDTSVMCDHIGTAFIGKQYWDLAKQKIKQIKDSMTEEEFKKFKQQNWD